MGRLLRAGVRWARRALALAAILLFLALGVLPRTGRYQTWTVLSQSMRPEMPAGSVAVVVPRPLDGLRVGDVLLYRPPAGEAPILAHRVVELERREGGVVVGTKGDANADPDPWRATIRSGQTAWVAVGVIPYLGFALKALQSDLARTLLLYLLPLSFVALALQAIWRPRSEPHEPTTAPDAPLGRRARGRPDVVAGSVAATGAPIGRHGPERPPRRRPRVAAPGWYAGALAGVAAGTGGPWYRPASAQSFAAPGLPLVRPVARTAAVGLLALGLTAMTAVPSASLLADTAVATHSVTSGAIAAPGPLTATPGCIALPLPQQFHVDLSWSEPADSITTGYRIERAIGGGSYTLLTTIGQRTTVTHRDSGLSASTTYHYRIQSTRGSWTSSFTGPASATTAPACT